MKIFLIYSPFLKGNEIRKRKKDIENGDEKHFTPSQIVRYLIDIVAGLSFLHERPIIHRDLKSDNVFVTLNERKEISNLAIGDFDRAKMLTQGTENVTVGTPGWIDL